MTKSFAIIALIGASLLALWGGITLASQQLGGGAAGAGSHSVDMNIQSDLCHHDGFIFRSPTGQLLSHNMKLTVDTGGPGTSITITGPSPWVTVTGTMGAGGDFEASGAGTVATFPNVTVHFTGAIIGGVLAGAYAFGANNELPPCDDDGNPATPPAAHPAVYGVQPKPGTPTPTGTPPKLYSIIVIKLNDDNLQPVPDWEIRLYAGTNCGGTALDTKHTDAKGMADFEGLGAGSYSVREINRAGWNPVGATCKGVALPGVTAAAVPACPIAPDQPFPQPGCDTFPSAARVQVRFNGTDAVVSADLGGQVQIERLNKPTDKNHNGLDEVNTEMVFMDLTGPGLTVRESPTRHSTGLIEEQHNVTSGVLDFPANSFFDIFFEVDVGGVTLHNETPLRMACKIDQVPPYKCFYEPPITTPIELLNADGVKIAKLVHGLHIPIPPNEVVVIFTNRPKTTPTVTATPTRTPTPHETTPTATPTNPPPNGTCTKTAQNVPLQGKVWDQWKCIPNPPNTPFNRVDVFVGTNQANPLLSAVHFVCQSTGEKVAGVFKVHKANVYPGTTLPNADIWSGTFSHKCVPGAAGGSVSVYVQPTSPPPAHPVIVQVAFTDNQPSTPTVTATPRPNVTPTPSPHPRNGDANKDGTTNAIDAQFVLQFSAGLIASVNPSADVNGDGATNPIDGTLILQFSAGLIDHLPI